MKKRNQTWKGIPVQRPLISETMELSRQPLSEMPAFKTVYISKQFDILRLNRFTVVDTETTGLDCEKDRIVQLSAIRYVKGKPAEAWDSYVNPKMPISPGALETHGITADMVRDAPLLEEVTESFLEFLGEDPVAGYNIKFDLQFLWCSGIDLITDQEIYDAMLSSYGVFPRHDRRLPKRNLVTVASYYGIDFPAHDSLGDVYATGEVLVRIAEAITGDKIGEGKDLRPLHEKIGTDHCRKELRAFSEMSYDAMVETLLEKYGPAEADYFTDRSCTMKNRAVSRTREGLYCHHIDEDRIPTLSDPMVARLHPFTHQKKDRLLYCNLLEHLLLHIRIGRDRFWKNHRVLDDPGLFREFVTHGVREISKDLNDMYLNEGAGLAWRERCYLEIAPFYEDYIEIQKAFLRYILDHYEAPEYPIVPTPGNAVLDEEDQLWTVVKCTKRTVVLQCGEKEERVPVQRFLKTEETPEEVLEEIRETLADTGYGCDEDLVRAIELPAL